MAITTLSMALAACTEPVTPAIREYSPATGTILTSFDRLTLARGDRTGFRASLVGPGANLGGAGLTFVSLNPAVARVSGGRGRAQVQALAAGRTWIVVQLGTIADSVEVVVQ